MNEEGSHPDDTSQKRVGSSIDAQVRSGVESHNAVTLLLQTVLEELNNEHGSIVLDIAISDRVRVEIETVCLARGEVEAMAAARAMIIDWNRRRLAVNQDLQDFKLKSYLRSGLDDRSGHTVADIDQEGS